MTRNSLFGRNEARQRLNRAQTDRSLNARGAKPTGTTSMRTSMADRRPRVVDHCFERKFFTSIFNSRHLIHSI